MSNLPNNHENNQCKRIITKMNTHVKEPLKLAIQRSREHMWEMGIDNKQHYWSMVQLGHWPCLHPFRSLVSDQVCSLAIISFHPTITWRFIPLKPVSKRAKNTLGLLDLKKIFNWISSNILRLYLSKYIKKTYHYNRRELDLIISF